MLRNLLFVGIALVLMMLVSSALGFITYQRRLRQLKHRAAARDGVDSWSHFLADFPDWPQERLRRIYDDLLIQVGLPDFPLLPSDRLIEDLDIDQGNLDDMLERQINANGGNYDEAVKKMDGKPFHTARDVVNWIGISTQIEDKNGPNL